jgi:hypothetical protein
VARRKKTSSYSADVENIKRFAEQVTDSTREIIKKIGIDCNMTPLTMVRTAREYLERQSNQERTCNNILFKLGVNKQFKGQTRKARIYALTALDEAMTNGQDFDPSNVPLIAEKRYNRIVGILGQDVETSVDLSSSFTDAVRVKTKKQVAVDIIRSNPDKVTGDLVIIIMDKLKIEKSNAYSVLSAARKSMMI